MRCTPQINKINKNFVSFSYYENSLCLYNFISIHLYYQNAALESVTVHVGLHACAQYCARCDHTCFTLVTQCHPYPGYAKVITDARHHLPLVMLRYACILLIVHGYQYLSSSMIMYAQVCMIYVGICTVFFKYKSTFLNPTVH